MQWADGGDGGRVKDEEQATTTIDEADNRQQGQAAKRATADGRRRKDHERVQVVVGRVARVLRWRRKVVRKRRVQCCGRHKQAGGTRRDERARQKRGRVGSGSERSSLSAEQQNTVVEWRSHRRAAAAGDVSEFYPRPRPCAAVFLARSCNNSRCLSAACLLSRAVPIILID